MLSIIRHHYLEAAALILNFAGTLLLSYSFQASSSDFRMTKLEYAPVGMRINNPPQHAPLYSICVKNEAILAHDNSSAIIVGNNDGCMSSDVNHVAIVTSDHPWAARWGLILNMIGFALQAIFLVSRPRTP